ncbi:MAG: hypothetical protein ABF304_05640 [Flavobacteriaceae bacterium]|jgi:hypothetical protein|nr:hypothetical protein [Flavobacteriaceae bacterium LSUCC0859]
MMEVQNILVAITLIGALGYLLLRWFFPRLLQGSKKKGLKDCNSGNCGCA